MKWLLSLLLFFLVTASRLPAQMVYYAVASGDNFEKITWHSATLKSFKASPPENVFDSYTVERHKDSSASVQREFTTPSGDWLLKLTYDYGKEGRLRAMHTEFGTFNASGKNGDEGGATRCVREFTVSDSGEMKKKSEKITDATSGKVVQREFWEPTVQHWMKLEELPVKLGK